LFFIRHDSLYRYDVPVQLGEHLVRLTPRPGSVRIAAHRITVEPEALGTSHETDAFGNAIVRLNFGGSTQRLRVLSEIELETMLPPELFPMGQRLPLTPGWDMGAAWPSTAERLRYLGDAIHPQVVAFASGLAAEVGHEPIAFLDHLAGTLFLRLERGIRPTGEARAAHETLALGSGACRDLTVVFLDACRSQGLPSRFVSGYQAQAQTPDGQRHLHAWAEVLVPGAGWRGWDPMHGVRVGDGHVALCAAPEQAATMPIEGGFFFEGPSVSSTLDCSVTIRTS
jgi:transglutaminase-like putative cysteine protease